MVLGSQADAESVVAATLATVAAPAHGLPPDERRRVLLRQAVRHIARGGSAGGAVDPVLPERPELMAIAGRGAIDRSHLHAALARLPVRGRLLLALHLVAGLDAGDLAAVLGATPGQAGRELETALADVHRLLSTTPELAGEITELIDGA